MDKYMAHFNYFTVIKIEIKIEASIIKAEVEISLICDLLEDKSYL